MKDSAPSPRRLQYLRDYRRRKRSIRLWQVCLLAGLFALWELTTRLGLSDGFLTSSPSRMAGTLQSLWHSGDLWRHIGTSCLETVVGFTAGTLLGTAIAVAMWWWEKLARVLDPYLVVLNALPKTALGPIFIVWMGAGMGAIIVMTLAISLIVTILTMYQGFMTTDPEKLRLMRSLGARRSQMLWLLVFPANCPTLFNTLKVNVGLSWVGVIMGEFLVSRAGLGYLIVYGSQVFNMDLVMTSVLILALAAVVMYQLVLRVEKILNRTWGGTVMKKVFACLLAVCMVLPALAGCSQPQETTAVRLSEVTHSVFYAPQYVAISQGFFADEGLTVELSNGGGADKVMTAVVSGQADIGLAGPEASIYVAQQGKEDPPVIFAQLTRRDGSFLVGRSDGPFRWEDLRGSTIIGGRAGGVPEMTLEYVLRQHGLTPGEDVTVDTSVQFNMMAGAFTGGGGDYVTLFEPTATEVEQAGKGYILCSIGQESGEIPYTAYFANRSYLTANAGTVQRFTNAIARAQRWVAEHTDREVAEAICGQFPDTDLAVLERVCARHREIDAWNLTPVMEQAALERLETVMTTAGQLKQEEWVDFDRLVDTSFAQKAS